MTGMTRKQQHLESVLRTQPLPDGIHLRCWQATDFPAIQRLSDAQGWPMPANRPEEALRSWEHSEPALVLYKQEQLIGFVRGLTDGEVTTYIAELLVDPAYRNESFGRLLLDVCHALHPHTRLDLIALAESSNFYKKSGFRDVGAGLRKSYR
ncbi:MAG TPA: GNAT family N-acetyltransferase [Ktedonobacteraceae bacterium]|nr:GNAT family N-acetyltransferase [Ktedonobacteraceae bacterium]